MVKSECTYVSVCCVEARRIRYHYLYFTAGEMTKRDDFPGVAQESGGSVGNRPQNRVSYMLRRQTMDLQLSSSDPYSKSPKEKSGKCLASLWTKMPSSPRIKSPLTYLTAL